MQKIEDWIGRNKSIEQLTSILEEEYKFEKDSYVLSLNAKYGDGKTTFLNLWQKFLHDKSHEVVYIDAWKHDFTKNPLISFCYELFKFFNKNDKVETKQKLSSSLKKVAAYSAIFTSQIFKNKLGVDAIEAQKLIDDINLEKLADTEFELFNKHVSLMEELQGSLRNYVSSLKGKPLFIFIDELDRARPDYSIKFLEIIKHVFSVKGIIFVISVDEEQLESIVKKTYGEGINFIGYYRKFVTTTFNLPSIYAKEQQQGESQVNSYVSKLYSEHIEINGRKTVLENDSSSTTRLDIIKEVLRSFELSLRDIKCFFKILIRYLLISDQQKTLYGYIDTASFLIALKISDKENYLMICNSDSSIDKIIKLIKKYNFDYYLESTILLALLSDESIHANKVRNTRLIEELKKNNRMKDRDLGGYYRQSFSHFGYNTIPAIKSVYKKLESLSSILSHD